MPNNLPFAPSALDHHRDALLALPEARVHHDTRLDPSATVRTVQRAIVAVAPHRDALVALCGPAAEELLDTLPSLAWATREAHIAWLARSRPASVKQVHERAKAMHRLLLTDADALVNRGLLPRHEVERARSTRGLQCLLDSLQILLAIFADAWPTIETRTMVTAEERAQATGLAFEAMGVLSRRAGGSAISPEADLRARALSSLVERYEELRRCVSYLRWHAGDADRLTPSLYAGRGGRGRRRPEPPPDEPSPDEPSPDR